MRTAGWPKTCSQGYGCGFIPGVDAELRESPLKMRANGVCRNAEPCSHLRIRATREQLSENRALTMGESRKRISGALDGGPPSNTRLVAVATRGDGPDETRRVDVTCQRDACSGLLGEGFNRRSALSDQENDVDFAELPARASNEFDYCSRVAISVHDDGVYVSAGEPGNGIVLPSCDRGTSFLLDEESQGLRK